MAGEYFGQVSDDFTNLGFHMPDISLLRNFPAYTRATGVLLATRQINQATAARLPDQSPELSTDIGLHVASLLRQGYNFGSNHHVVCINAEARLAMNLRMEVLEDNTQPTVAILTADDGTTPIGIIKGKNETSCYGLANDIKAGIVAGGFSSPTLPAKLRGSLLQRDRPMVFDVRLLPPMVPKRLGIFYYMAGTHGSLRRIMPMKLQH